MKGSRSTAFSGLKLLKGGVSVVALTAMAAGAMPAFAQDAAAGGEKEVVVVGVRKSLKSAQQIKKDADTVVDSITASDIGSFPDKSVAEALQRIAGITVNRFAASDDTAHFSAEPSGVVVRGLQQVRAEFNGRDIFTADSNRGLSWSDVSPELMGGVDVYKNQTAELIEGGIAGTVNLRTRLPFDQKGRLMAVSLDYTWGDVSKQGKPTVSGIFADRWSTEMGEFGVMLNAAHSDVVSASQGVNLNRYAAIVSPAFGSSGTAEWGNPTKKYLPSGVRMFDTTYDRVRDGISLAGQWQNNEHTMLATLQYNQSKKREQMEEHVLTASTGVDVWQKPLTWVSDGVDQTICATGSTCTFANGGFVSGTLATDINSWMTTYPANTGAVDSTESGYTCYSWSCPNDSSAVRGTRYSATSRYSDGVNDTKDISFNFKWDVTDRLKLNFDVQHVDATQTNYDIDGTLKTYATVGYNLTGETPTITVSDPLGFNSVPGGVTNAGNYQAAYFMDHVTDSDGKMDAVRLDAAYSFDSPWLNTLKAGVRVADRQQTVRWSTYNWKASTHDWESYDKNNFYVNGSVFPTGTYESATLGDNWMGGGVLNQPQGIFYKMDLIKNQGLLASTFGNQSYKPNSSSSMTNEWVPICYRSDEIDGCFRSAELSDVEEKTTAAYIQLKFGGNDATIFGGVTVVGNIGVRYVETQNISTGGVNYSTMTYASNPTSPPPPMSPPGTPDVYNYSYFIPGLTGTPPAVTADPIGDPTGYAAQVAARNAYVNNPANFTEDRKFMQPSSQKATSDVTHKNWLPSFNVRLGLTDKWFLRFAASRALSRPDIGNLKAYASVGAAFPSASETVCGKALICTGTTPTKAVMTYSGSAQNPLLKPVTADQFDLSVENYFSSTGSVTLNLFYKKFHDYIQFGSYYRNFTNNGVTREVLMNGPMNGDGASIKGFEVAYQSFFDFLPAPFNGFGVQANYTHLVNSGISGAAVKKETAGDSGSADADIGGILRGANSFVRLPLEQLSDNSYNLIGMYEKGQWSARVAYNWRSEFMVTAQDCCTTFPVWQKAAGYMDGRLAFRLNDHFEFSLEGSNLLNTQTELMQQVDGPVSDPLHPEYLTREVKFLNSSWNKSERRLTAAVRIKY